MFFMGFDGTEVTPHIRTLIEDHHLGSILLTTKNLICKSRFAKLHKGRWEVNYCSSREGAKCSWFSRTQLNEALAVKERVYGLTLGRNIF